MELTTRHTKKVAILAHPYHGLLYLNPPTWEINRYWSWGYFQNKSTYKHLDTLIPGEFVDFLLPRYQDYAYTLLELFENYKVLKEYSDVCYRGGCQYKRLPEMQKLLHNEEEHRRINEEVIPKIFDELYKILNKEK